MSTLDAYFRAEHAAGADRQLPLRARSCGCGRGRVCIRVAAPWALWRCDCGRSWWVLVFAHPAPLTRAAERGAR